MLRRSKTISSQLVNAVALAEADDVVVIAGKGHEQGQEFVGGLKLPFDDIAVAREVLRARIAAVGLRAGDRLRHRQ